MNLLAAAPSATQKPASSSSTDAQDLLLLVDGHNLAYRFYYALAASRNGGLTTSTGIPTSITHGFLRGLKKMLAEEKPTAVAVAFDHPGGSFRCALGAGNHC